MLGPHLKHPKMSPESVSGGFLSFSGIKGHPQPCFSALQASRAPGLLLSWPPASHKPAKPAHHPEIGVTGGAVRCPLRAGGCHATNPTIQSGERGKPTKQIPKTCICRDRTLMVLSPRLAIVRSAVTRVSYEKTPLSCFRYSGATGLDYHVHVEKAILSVKIIVTILFHP